jgi:RHS repeat-associated protein
VARQPRPHAPIRVGGQPYAYDANGNLTSGGGRTFVWNGWNQLAGVSQAGVTETYAYDAAGARVTRTSNGATVVTVADLWERTVGGATTHFYRFGADVIGVRRSDQGTQYLFSDHLGSVSAATNASGALVGMQHYDPWGRVRTGGIGLTARTFTGQRLDATGLLYYHARYYDPTLGRFISPDSIVPEPGNPQSFNRFAYVYNNPLKYTDPTGHWIERAVDIAFIAYDIWDIHQNGLTWDNGLALAADVGGLLLPGLTGVGMAVRGGRAAHAAGDVANAAADVDRLVNQTDTAAEIGVIAYPSKLFGPDDPGHIAVYTTIGDSTHVRGFYPQRDYVPRDDPNFLFNHAVPGEVRDDYPMLDLIGKPGVVTASRPVPVAEAQRLRAALGEPGPRSSRYSWNPDNFPDTFNCSTWACWQINQVVEPGLEQVRQGRMKLTVPAVQSLPPPWRVR